MLTIKVFLQYKKERKWIIMKIFAHRGFSGEYPENTMLAFIKAEETGCDGIELDVQLTKDGVMVLIHDESIDRTSDGTGLVRDYTYQELLLFDFSGKFTDKFGVQRIPTFQEYLEWVKEKDIITNIELKNNVYYYTGLEEMVLEAVKKHGLIDRVLISSFNHVSVLKCRRLAPEIRTAFLTETSFGNAGRYVSENGVDYYHPKRKWLTKEEIENCHKHGVEVNVWTVNTEEDLQNVQECGVDGIFTNYPELCLNQLNYSENSKYT